MGTVKCVGILTSGGDAPGMNAAIRAVTRAAIYNGLQVKGIYRGYRGLVTGEISEFKSQNVSNIIQLGGTILKTARCKEFTTPEGRQLAYDNMKKEGIDALVVIGGDGSFMGARALSDAGVPCIGIPGTIDNDIACSDYTVGFDTAMNTAMEMVDKIRDTSQSHDRCSVVEVMGRRCGDIALQTGISCGATAILVPEVPYNIEQDVISRILETRKNGKQHFIVVVAEGVGGSVDLAKYIERRTGIESRATILGHVQRGGSPTLRDRVVASEMGYKAVELLAEGKSKRVVALKDGKIVDYDITEALNMERVFDTHLYEIAKTISM